MVLAFLLEYYPDRKSGSYFITVEVSGLAFYSSAASVLF